MTVLNKYANHAQLSGLQRKTNFAKNPIGFRFVRIFHGGFYRSACVIIRIALYVYASKKERHIKFPCLPWKRNKTNVHFIRIEFCMIEEKTFTNCYLHYYRIQKLLDCARISVLSSHYFFQFYFSFIKYELTWKLIINIENVFFFKQRLQFFFFLYYFYRGLVFYYLSSISTFVCILLERNFGQLSEEGRPTRRINIPRVHTRTFRSVCATLRPREIATRKCHITRILYRYGFAREQTCRTTSRKMPTSRHRRHNHNYEPRQ